MRKSRKKIKDQGLRLAIEKAGSQYRLARIIGITLPALTRWERIPLKRLLQVEKLLEIPREKLRPDMFRR
jgi:DNA-binding transcriptional regulator YdaS (Cro superfamily)